MPRVKSVCPVPRDFAKLSVWAFPKLVLSCTRERCSFRRSYILEHNKAEDDKGEQDRVDLSPCPTFLGRGVFDQIDGLDLGR